MDPLTDITGGDYEGCFPQPRTRDRCRRAANPARRWGLRGGSGRFALRARCGLVARATVYLVVKRFQTVYIVSMLFTHLQEEPYGFFERNARPDGLAYPR